MQADQLQPTIDNTPVETDNDGITVVPTDEKAANENQNQPVKITSNGNGNSDSEKDKEI